MLSKQKEFGSKWELLAVFFKGRTPISLRNRWISITRANSIQNQKEAKEEKSERLKESESDDKSGEPQYLKIENLLSRKVDEKEKKN